jgi:hypothetical protein
VAPEQEGHGRPTRLPVRDRGRPTGRENDRMTGMNDEAMGVGSNHPYLHQGPISEGVRVGRSPPSRRAAVRELALAAVRELWELQAAHHRSVLPNDHRLGWNRVEYSM